MHTAVSILAVSPSGTWKLSPVGIVAFLLIVVVAGVFIATKLFGRRSR